MTFKNFLAAIGMIMVFGMTLNCVTSYKADYPIKFPEGFFCDVICDNWGILAGNTIMCFISHQGGYERFVARNPAYGVWRFYQVDVTSKEESICHLSLFGDEYFLNNTDVLCPPYNPHPKRYYIPEVVKNEFSRFEEYSGPAVRNGVDSRVPMDAICELATSQFCRHGKIITCTGNNKCCDTKVTPPACAEESMGKFNDCYKALYNVIQNTSY